jgi:hypothetical protein
VGRIFPYACSKSLNSYECGRMKGVFSFAKRCKKSTVARFGFISKRSSRKVQPSCIISFWFHLHLVLHACIASLMWRGIFYLHSAFFFWGTEHSRNVGRIFQYASICIRSYLVYFYPKVLGARVCSVPKIFHSKTSHRILWHMHGALNVDETKKTNCTVHHEIARQIFWA